MFGAMALPLLALSIDMNGVGTVIPEVQSELRVDLGALGWMVNVTALTFAATLIPVGRLAPRIGNRRFVLAGVSLFGAASVVCGLAPDLPVLLIGRVLQGVGGVLTFTTSLAVISNMFDGARRAAAVGAWGVVNGLGGSLGPLVGGAATSLGSWRTFFVINVPLCLLALPAIASLSPRDVPVSDGSPLPWLKLAMFGGAAVSLIVGLQNSAVAGWTGFPTIAGLVVAALLAAGLLRARPGAQGSVFTAAALSAPLLRVAGVAAFAANWGFGVTLVFVGLYLQRVRGLDPFKAGLLFSAFSASSAVAGLTVGTLTRRFGTSPSLSGSLVLAATGLGLAAMLPEAGSLAVVVAVLVIGGIAQGLAFDLSTLASLEGVESQAAGEAAALTSVIRSMGLTIGIALSSTLAASFALAGAVDGLLAGIRAALVVAAIVAAAGAAGVAALSPTRPAAGR